MDGEMERVNDGTLGEILYPFITGVQSLTYVKIINKRRTAKWKTSLREVG